MKKLLIAIASLAILTTSAAVAAEDAVLDWSNRPSAVKATGTIAEFIQFINIVNEATLNFEPEQTGWVESSLIEIIGKSNAFVRVDYINGPKLAAKVGGGTYELDTKFNSRVVGKCNWDGTDCDFSGGWSGWSGDGAPSETGTIIFEPGPLLGVRTKVSAFRKGLADHYGTYSTTCTLTWTKW